MNIFPYMYRSSIAIYPYAIITLSGGVGYGIIRIKCIVIRIRINYVINKNPLASYIAKYSFYHMDRS